jgi:flagellar biosynthesis protein FlhF
MKVKTFHALTMQDAMRAIKEELGPEAIILSSKEVHQGGRMLRVFNRPVLEVMAACEQDVPLGDETPVSVAQPPVVEQAAPAPAAQSFHAALRSAMAPPASPVQPIVAEPATSLKQAAGEKWKHQRLQQLRVELRELSCQLAESLPPEVQSIGTRIPPAIARLCRSFVQQGMRPSIAEALGDDLVHRLGLNGSHRQGDVAPALQESIARLVRTSGPILYREGSRAVALILGPSGAGKTSIVTKLAAYHRMELKQSVAVVTLDAYREVSVEQLRRYARALGVPFAAAQSPRQLHQGLRRHGRADVVLIDMPGAGQEEMSSAAELHRLLGEECAVSTHVVLPASSQERDLCRILDRVKDLPSLHLLFTKLDDTECFGTIVDVASRSGLPLSYWGVGQRVPEDIELASPERLAECLMAQRYVVSRAPMSRSHRPLREVLEPGAVGAMYEMNECQEESSCRAR